MRQDLEYIMLPWPEGNPTTQSHNTSHSLLCGCHRCETAQIAYLDVARTPADLMLKHFDTIMYVVDLKLIA